MASLTLGQFYNCTCARDEQITWIYWELLMLPQQHKAQPKTFACFLYAILYIYIPGRNVTKKHWKWRVVMMPTLLFLAAPKVVIMTTSVAPSNNKISIMVTLSFQCNWTKHAGGNSRYCGNGRGHKSSLCRLTVWLAWLITGWTLEGIPLFPSRWQFHWQIVFMITVACHQLTNSWIHNDVDILILNINNMARWF